MKHKFIIGQVVFVLIVLTLIFVNYPRVQLNQEGELVVFKKIGGANGLVIADNSNFENARFVELNENDEVSFRLSSGKYYWKAVNSYLESASGNFEIKSTVAMNLEDLGNGDGELKNVGDVKINITRTKDGKFVGRIILEPNASSIVENNGTYSGRQDD